MARRQSLTFMLALSVIMFVVLTYIMSGDEADHGRPNVASAVNRPPAASAAKQQQPGLGGGSGSAYIPTSSNGDEAVLAHATADAKADMTDMKPGAIATEIAALSDDVLTGGSIAPKLENATIKAELGRASWKLLHTMVARFPEQPTPDEQLALKTWITLLARLYPCGECAEHFRKLLAKYPPQVGSRNAAAGWACFVHNEVNKRLHKEQFDCSKIGDFYDCGCGDDHKGEGEDKKTGTGVGSEEAGKTATGSAATDGALAGEKDLKERTKLDLEE